MISVFTIHQKNEWTSYVQKANQFDFYHTWFYHSLDSSGDPMLFVYQENDDFIALPLLKRPIPGTPYFDLISVYGYAGPISNREFENLSELFMENFKIGLLTYLRKNNIISVFSRLHPFFNQDGLIQKFGGLHDNGKTVVIDLTIPLEEQRKRYRRNHLATVKQQRKRGFTVKEASTQEEILQFIDIYTENMKRIGATEYYLFNEEYFVKLLQATEFEGKLILVYFEGEVICGSIITCTQDIVQGHLIGTRSDYLHYSPAKFLVDEITLLARKMGMKYYQLGGGLGFKEDSLFNWKKGFSEYFLDYRSWRFIVNEEVYYQLVDEKGIDRNLDIDFFPLYRCNLVHQEC